jgi:hypothetical protein
MEKRWFVVDDRYGGYVDVNKGLKSFAEAQTEAQFQAAKDYKPRLILELVGKAENEIPANVKVTRI